MDLFSAAATRHTVSVLTASDSVTAVSDQLRTKIQPLGKISVREWKKVSSLQGLLGVLYLWSRYRFGKNYLLTAYSGDELAHVEWVVSSESIKDRYPFVSANAYAIISCVTSPTFRGQGVYPASLSEARCSGIADKYFIWADKNNSASLRGIEKAGGVKVGSFDREKRFGGLISKVCYKKEVR